MGAAQTPRAVVNIQRRNAIATALIVVVVVVIIVVAGVITYVYVSSPSPSNPKAPSQITLGAVLTLTGANAQPAADQEIGLNWWTSYVNAHGGLYLSKYGTKVPVKVIVLDDKSDPSNDPALISELVNQDNVSAILSGTALYNAPVILPIAERDGVPYVSMYDFYNSTWNYYSQIDPHPNWAFFAWPNFAGVANVFWNWYDAQNSSNRPTSVAAVAANVAGFNVVSQMWLNQAQARGLNVTMPLQVYDVTSTDLTSLVLKLKAANPQVVWAFSVVTDGELLLKEANELGFHPKLWIMPATAEFTLLGKSLGTLANGIVTDTTWVHLMTTNDSANLNSYYMNQTKGLPADPFAANYAAITQVLFDAIVKAGSTNRPAIRDALATINASTVEGQVVFDSNHNSYTLNNIIVQWQNGGQQIVWPPDIATAEFQYPSPNAG